MIILYVWVGLSILNFILWLIFEETYRIKDIFENLFCCFIPIFSTVYVGVAVCSKFKNSKIKRWVVKILNKKVK